MAELIISEQDIINSLCVYISRKKQVNPQEVEVELMYDTMDSLRKHMLREENKSLSRQILSKH